MVLRNQRPSRAKGDSNGGGISASRHPARGTRAPPAVKQALAIPLQFVAYLGFRAAEGIIGLLPLSACLSLGAALGSLAHYLSPPLRRLVVRNLTIAYHGEMARSEIETLAKRHFAALGRNLLASMRTALMSNEEIEAIVTYDGVENFARGIEAGNGVIGALTHTSNWELYARIAPLGGDVAFGTIYQGIRNPFISRLIVRRRSALGTRLFERAEGFRGPADFLRQGGALGVLMDQYPGLRGMWAPFFGRLTPTTTLPALLSLRTGAPVMFVGMNPDGPGKWKITFHPPIYPPEDRADKDAFIRGVTAELNEKLAANIRAHPEEWFWVHNRFKSSGQDIFPYLRRFEIAMPEGSATSDFTPCYLLLRSPNPLGDACMALPAVRAAKRGRPDAHITILCRKNLVPLWERQPEVDDIIAIPGRPSPGAVGRLIRERRPYYDAAILFPNSTRCALEVRSGGVPMIYGYAGHLRERMLRWVVPEPPADPPPHHRDRYLHIVASLGADITGTEILSEPPAPSPIYLGQKRWRICLSPGAEFGEAKRWPRERYAETVSRLRRELPEHIIEISIVGSLAEASLGEELAAQIHHPRVNLAGRTTIGELIDHLSSCHLVLSNDTGTMHLAAALGVPTVAIFGSTDPDLTRPSGESHRVIREKVECSPCFKRTCPIDFRCMTRIKTEQVVRELREMMRA